MITDWFRGFPSRVKLNYITVRTFKQHFKNYMAVYNAQVLNHFPVKANLRTGESVVLYSWAHVAIQILGYDIVSYDDRDDITEFRALGKLVKLKGLLYGGDISVFSHSYQLDVRDKVVLDIGANIGDSALSFVQEGAKKVVAVESDPFSFKLLNDNVDLNGLNSRIITLNAAFSGHSSKIRIPFRPQNTLGNSTSSSDHGLIVNTTTLREIVGNLDIPQGSIAKIDCEGCEYDSLTRASTNDLKLFDQFGIEYHYGSETLVNLFRDIGYSITFTEPKTYYSKSSNPHLMKLGMLYAKNTKPITSQNSTAQVMHQ